MSESQGCPQNLCLITFQLEGGGFSANATCSIIQYYAAETMMELSEFPTFRDIFVILIRRRFKGVPVRIGH